MTATISHASSASYAVSGYSNRMGWGSKPALLVIDVCTAYWTEGSPLDLSSNPAALASPDSMRRLLTAARTSGVPILWSTVKYSANKGPAVEAPLFHLKAKMLDLWTEGDTRGWSEWMPGLEPRDGETVFSKKYASAFFGTDLKEALDDLGVDTVVICGVSTSGCVRASTLDAMQNGFRPMVVGVACGDRSEEIQRSNLFDLNAKYADVVTEEEAVERLSQSWAKQ